MQNEINCMNDSRDFQDAESVRSGHSHVTSQPVSFPPHPIPGGVLSRSRRSAKNSVILCERDSLKNYGADQQRLQISDLHFDNFPTPATFACRKIRFKTDVCTCSQFPAEAMHWIKRSGDGSFSG